MGETGAAGSARGAPPAAAWWRAFMSSSTWRHEGRDETCPVQYGEGGGGGCARTRGVLLRLGARGMIGDAHEHVVRQPRCELLRRVLRTRGGQVSRARPVLWICVLDSPTDHLFRQHARAQDEPRDSREEDVCKVTEDVRKVTRRSLQRTARLCPESS